MGYYTNYTLTWEPGPDYEPSDIELSERIGRYIEDNDEISYALCRDGSTYENVKWYNHMESLEEMSRDIPGVMFHLAGEGEEAGDLWDAYFKDGRSEKIQARIIRAEKPNW
jgi:hypothetical protein